MKIAILGNGIMGSELHRQTGWDIFSRDGIDITDMNTFWNLRYNYDTFVNCIGYTKTRDPEREPAWTVNYKGVMDLVDFCNVFKIKLIHLSTDFIYCGSPKPAKETDCPVHFDNWYTYTKLLSDAYVQARCKDYLLIRTSFKPKPFPYERALTTRDGNFDYADIIGAIIVKLIKAGAEGVYNVGTQPKTMFRLARESRPDVGAIWTEITPKDTTMDLTKLKKFLNNGDKKKT